jgi:hypothetical protein
MNKFYLMSAVIFSIAFTSLSNDTLVVKGAVIKECAIDSSSDQIHFMIKSNDSVYTCVFRKQWREILNHKDELWGKILLNDTVTVQGKMLYGKILLYQVIVDNLQYPRTSFSDTTMIEVNGIIRKRLSACLSEKNKYQFTIEAEGKEGLTVCVLGEYPASLYNYKDFFSKKLLEGEKVTVYGKFSEGKLSLYRVRYKKSFYPKFKKK